MNSLQKLISVIIFLIPSLISFGQLEKAELDQLIRSTLEAFDVPGISVGIVKDGKVVYADGHGVRSMNNNLPMDENTLVGIASNSKGFTCFALGMLVDEGKINWDDKVRKYIPEFKMYDPWVTEEFTIRDLVTHRSGLPLGAGDLMFFPEGGDFNVEDVIHNVRFLEPSHSFRSTFMYNNNMFIIAGEVIHRVSGLTWEEFIENRIMKPMGMKSSKASYNRVKDKSNIIDAHLPVDGVVQAIPHDWSETANAAGGNMSNITDMLVWAEFLMNGGVTKDGTRLISERQMHELWQLQTPLSVGPDHPYNTHFRGYGLGWFLSDVNGYKEVTHTGGLIGTVTQFTIIPEIDLGIVVLTNQMVGAAFTTITNTIKDSYLGYEDRNWLAQNKKRMDRYYAYNDSLQAVVYSQVDKMLEDPDCLNEEAVVGTYTDAWFGDIVIKKEGDRLTINCVKSPRLFGQLLPYNATTYVAKWNDRSYDADAFVLFNFDEKGRAIRAEMKFIAPITDFSFDFHDLKLERK